MKKSSVSALISMILNGVAFVSVLVAMIFIFISNGVSGYQLKSFGLIIALVIAGLVTTGASAATTKLFGEHHFITVILSFASIILITFGAGMLILNRSALVAAQFTYDKVNTAGWDALIPSFVAIGASLLADILLIVAAFLGDKKSSEAK